MINTLISAAVRPCGLRWQRVSGGRQQKAGDAGEIICCEAAQDGSRVVPPAGSCPRSNPDVINPEGLRRGFQGAQPGGNATYIMRLDVRGCESTCHLRSIDSNMALTLERSCRRLAPMICNGGNRWAWCQSGMDDRVINAVTKGPWRLAVTWFPLRLAWL